MKNGKLVWGLVAMLAAALTPAVALAEGGVKVECYGRCDLVTLGQVCDNYSTNSIPVAVACDLTSVGSGVSNTCGAGLTCRPWGSYSRYDALSGYCDDGPGFDAVVTCRPAGAFAASTGAQLERVEPKIEKLDDGAGARPQQ
jgi:hypothetical protein